jgi:hypothetical protein
MTDFTVTEGFPKCDRIRPTVQGHRCLLQLSGQYQVAQRVHVPLRITSIIYTDRHSATAMSFAIVKNVPYAFAHHFHSSLDNSEINNAMFSRTAPSQDLRNLSAPPGALEPAIDWMVSCHKMLPDSFSINL